MFQASQWKLTFLLSFILFSFSLSALVNKTTFKGALEDEAGLPIPGATLMVLDAVDSTLVQFGTSDTQGAFTIKNIPKATTCSMFPSWVWNPYSSQSLLD